MDNEVAGPGEIFVCTDCGRRSKDKLGFRRVHSGWSLTCSQNAVKYQESDLRLGRAKEVIGILGQLAPRLATN